VFALTVASVPALAADLPMHAPVVTKAPPPVAAPVFNWTGPYAGLHAGYGWGSGDHAVTLDGFLFLVPDGLPVDIDGWSAGGQIGYNWQSGNYVFGIEADISWADIEGFSYTVPDDDGYETKVDWFGTVRGRLGYAVDRGLGYITGGLAYGRIKAEMGDIDLNLNFDPSTGTARDSGTKYGWTAGAGVEYAFAPNWTARIEYLYVDLGKFEFNGTASNNGNPVRADIKTNFHLVRGGVNLRW